MYSTRKAYAMDTSSKENLYALIKDFDVAMLVTSAARDLHARPMAIASLDAGMGAYLVSSINSLKVDEINANPLALLTFQSARQFASVRGAVTVVHDRAMIEAMWKDAWKLWFAGGKSDPSITLLKFTAYDGEYWDNAGMRGLKFVYNAAVAYVAGGKPQANSAQHAKVSLQEGL